jgi:DNA-binding transcriptional ArsR family regulator
MVESPLQLDTLFHALADTTRRAILSDLATRAKTVGELADPFPISLAAVSKHLKVLEAAKLIERERRGSYQVVRLNAQSLRPAKDWLAFYDKFWNDALDRLQTHLEKTSNEEKA